MEWTPLVLEALMEQHGEISELMSKYIDSNFENAAYAKGSLETLRAHMHFEEEELFPYLDGLGHGGEVSIMLSEHSKIREAMKIIDGYLVDHSVPNFHLDSLFHFLSMIERHHELEEMIIYRRLAVHKGAFM